MSANAGEYVKERAAAPAIVDLERVLNERDNEIVELRPTSIEFRDAIPGTVQSQRVRVRNKTMRNLKIRVFHPHCRAFEVFPKDAYLVIGPGLTGMLRVVCRGWPQEAKGLGASRHDEIRMKMKDSRLVVKINAFAPRPEIRMRSSLSAGNVVLRRECRQRLRLENRGAQAGTYSFLPRENSKLSFEPKSGTIGPAESVDTTVTMATDTVGDFREAVIARLGGGDAPGVTRVVDVSWSVVSQSIEIVNPSDRTPLGAIDFGPVFFGPKVLREVPALVVNNSPSRCTFVIKLDRPSSKLDSEGKPAVFPEGARIKPEIFAVPAQGDLAPGQAMEVKFSFKPGAYNRREGFVNDGKIAAVTTQYANTMRVESTGLGVSVGLPVAARAVTPDAEISHTRLNFGDCPVNCDQTIVVNLRNRSNEIPLDFALPRVAHFGIRPRRGTIPPLRNQEIQVTFKPNALGRYRSSLKLSLAKGARVVNIKLRGNAEFIAPRPKLKGGTSLVASDFKKGLTLIESVKPPRIPKRKFSRRSGVRNPELTATMSRMTDPARLNATPGFMGLDGQTQELSYTYTLEEFESKLANKARFDNYNRTRRKRRLGRTGGRPRAINDPFVVPSRQHDADLERHAHGIMSPLRESDMGMRFAEGLASPAMKLPEPQYDLQLAYAMGGYGIDGRGLAGVDDGPASAAGSARGGKSGGRVFKPLPTTQAESRDCEMKLSHDEVFEIVAEPKTVDLGSVYCGSEARGQFRVRNGTKQSILVEVRFQDPEAPELSTSTPMSQMIPARETGVFTVALRPTEIDSYRRVVYYTVNRYLNFNFVVVADVLPVTLGLSKRKLDLRFDELTSEFYTTAELEVSNPADIDADFWCDIDSDFFTVNPRKGLVGAGQTKVLKAMYIPKYAQSKVSKTLTVNVRNGPSAKVDLVGELKEAKCKLSPRTVNFGAVCVGGRKTSLVNLENLSAMPVAYKLDPLPIGIRVEPSSGMVQPGTKQKMTVVCEPKAAADLGSSVLFYLRGASEKAKPTLLNIKGDCVLPEIVAVQSEISFASTEIGKASYAPVTFENRSQVPVTLVLNLALQREFTAVFPDAWAEIMPAPPILPVSRMDLKDLDLESARGAWADGSKEGGGEEGDDTNVFKMNLPKHSRIKFLLKFTPAKTGSHIFELPVSVVGISNYPSLRRVVNAHATKSKIRITPSIVDIGKRIIHKGTVGRPHIVELTIANQQTQPTRWRLYIGKQFAGASVSSGKERIVARCSYQASVEFKDGGAEGDGKAAAAAERKGGSKAAAVAVKAPSRGGSGKGGGSGGDTKADARGAALAGDAKHDSETGDVVASGAKGAGDLGVYRNNGVVVYRANPAQGVLRPGETTTVMLNFVPHDPIDYSTDLQILLDDDAFPYLSVNVDARGSYPALRFDRPVVELPVTPVGIGSSARFLIKNDGYADLDVGYNLPEDQLRVPLSVYFPTGNKINRSTNQIEAVISFVAKRPMSFSAKIDFKGLSGAVFPISVFGRADNCLLSNQEFLISDTKRQIGRADGLPDGAIDLVERMDSPVKGSAGGGAGRGGPPNEAGGEAAAPVTLEQEWGEGSYEWRSASFLVRFLWATTRNPLFSNLPVDYFPSGLAKGVGEFIGIIESLANKKIAEIKSSIRKRRPSVQPGSARSVPASARSMPASARSAAAKSGGKKEKKGPNAFAQFKKLELFLNYLRGFGALVDGVRPEHLMTERRFVRLLSDPKFASKHIEPHTSKADVPKYRTKLRKAFPAASRAAWLVLLGQVIKCFVLNRVTPASFKSLPGMSFNKAATMMPGWASKCRVYSLSECILLRWLEAQCNRNSSDGRNIVLTRFDRDLGDGKVFAKVLKSYIPSLESTLTINPKPKNDKDREANTLQLLSAIKRIGLPFALQLSDFERPLARDMMLVALYLYQNLPNYYPKANIAFKTRLGDSTTKSVELSNPSKKKPITYKVKLEGSRDFRVESKSVTLNPKGKRGAKVSIPVHFTARFSDPREARLTLTSDDQSNTNAATVVFALRSHVKERRALSTALLDAVPLYEHREAVVQVKNVFERDCAFAVSLINKYKVEVPSQKKTRGSGQTSARRGGKKRGGGTVRQVDQDDDASPCNKIAFWTHVEKLKIAAGETKNVRVSFVAFTPGKYECEMVLLDTGVGEIMHKVTATTTVPQASSAPAPHQATLSGGPIQHKFRLLWDNVPLSRACRFVTKELAGLPRARRRDMEVREKLKWCAGQPLPESVSYRVECDSPFFKVPSTVTIATAAAAKAAAASVDVDGKESAAVPSELPIQIEPKEAGVYRATATLKSAYDVRCVQLEVKIKEPTAVNVLEFDVKAGKRVVQTLPIVNSSKSEWRVAVGLEGKFFSGPRSVTVEPGGRYDYPLTFAPPSVADVKGELVMTITKRDDTDEVKYVLRGRGSEPGAEGRVRLECRARETVGHTFRVPNGSSETTTFRVESDLPNISGAESITVGGGGTGSYSLQVRPPVSGVISGSITFVAADGRFSWYAVEIDAAPPNPETELEVPCVVRRAAQIEIPVANPLNEEITFEMQLDGTGLHGEPFLRLGPREQGVYSFVFAPLVPGTTEGEVRFYNKQAGEFLYLLKLDARRQDPILLPRFECPVGDRIKRTVVLTNGTDVAVDLKVQCSDSERFGVVGDFVRLPANGSVSVDIWHFASAVGEESKADIRLSHPDVGEWLYRVSGVGVKRAPMSVLKLHAPVNSNVTKILTFKNPFTTPVEAKVALRTGRRRRSAFSVMLKKKKQTVRPGKTISIPVVFRPEAMVNYDDELVVTVREGVAWRYPLLGVTQGPTSARTIEISTKARVRVTRTIELELAGIQSRGSSAIEELSVEVECPEADEPGEAWKRDVVENCATFDLVDSRIASPQTTVRVRIDFDPLRPIKTTCELLVMKKSGGCWKFDIALLATDPDVDDTIRVESGLGRTSSVAFQLNNMLDGDAKFQAFMTNDSPPEFSVAPSSGVLRPEGKEATRFFVSFSPTEYGKPTTGTLVIRTNVIQWTYRIKGVHPKYKKPVVESTMRDMLRPKAATQRRPPGKRGNIILKNINAVKGATIYSGRRGVNKRGGAEDEDTFGRGSFFGTYGQKSPPRR